MKNLIIELRLYLSELLIKWALDIAPNGSQEKKEIADFAKSYAICRLFEPMNKDS